MLVPPVVVSHAVINEFVKVLGKAIVQLY